MNLVAHVHLPCISVLLFIKFLVLVGFLPKWWNREILSFMQSLHDFVPAVFINDNAEPVDISSNCRVFRHQAETSSLQENSVSWMWAHKCLERVEHGMALISLSSIGRNSWVLAWTRSWRFSLGFPAGVPNSCLKGLTLVCPVEAVPVLPDGDGSGLGLAWWLVMTSESVGV